MRNKNRDDARRKCAKRAARTHLAGDFVHIQMDRQREEVSRAVRIRIRGPVALSGGTRGILRLRRWRRCHGGGALGALPRKCGAGRTGAELGGHGAKGAPSQSEGAAKARGGFLLVKCTKARRALLLSSGAATGPEIKGGLRRRSWPPPRCRGAAGESPQRRR